MKLPLTTHRLSIAGKVVDACTGQPVEGVGVTLAAMPPAFADRLAVRALQHGAAWEKLSERPDRTRTAPDGGFHFSDLPDGAYTLLFALRGAPHRYGPLRRDFTAPAPIAEVALPPTGIRGQVRGLVHDTPTALPLARVRVRGSGESAWCDARGRFYLTGVELGARELRVTANGFQSATTSVQVSEGRVTELPPLLLQPATE